MSVKDFCLVFDSGATLKNGQYKDVFVIPLCITEVKKGAITTYKDGVDITNDQLVDKLLSGATMKTSQSVPADVLGTIEKLSKQYKQVFVFPLPYHISKQSETLTMLCNDYKNVTVFNKQNTLTILSEWLVKDIFYYQKQGKKITVDFINDYLERTKYSRFCCLYVPDFSYLVRGGRVSKTKGALATLLHIKAVITYGEKDGLAQFDKTMNVKNIPNIFLKACKSLYPKFNAKDVRNVWIGYTNKCDPKYKFLDVIDSIKKTIQYPSSATETMCAITSAITCHTGPNYVAFGFDLSKR